MSTACSKPINYHCSQICYPGCLFYGVPVEVVSQHSPGAKLDTGKPRVGLVLGGFARALLEVSKVGTFGANKYSDNGWIHVADGVHRYHNAKCRHGLEGNISELDPESGYLHAAHEAWNALAKLDLMLRSKEGAALAKGSILGEQRPAPGAPVTYSEGPSGKQNVNNY